jgi:release factor glutamine methyltransferase
LSQISEILSDLHQRLKPVSETPLLDAQVLCAFVLEKPRAWIQAYPENAISCSQQKTLYEYLARLLSGEPLPYILGRWEFYGLEFKVTPDTLIPRPETELLIEHALIWLDDNSGPCMAADIGTGCGCIAVSLAANKPDIRMLASDISFPALQIAKSNARHHRRGHAISFVQCDLIPPIEVKFDLICANLPYIPSGRLSSLTVADWEPEISLNGGRDGLDQIRRLLAGSRGRISSNGAVLLEVDICNAARAANFARQIYPQAEVKVIQDLSGRDRLLILYL